MTSNAFLPLFDQLFQICFVTFDLDAAMARLQRVHGVRSFRRAPAEAGR